MEYINDRLTIVTERIEEYRSHGIALEQLSQAYEDHLERTALLQASPAKTKSPARRRVSSSSNRSPLRRRSFGRRLSGNFSDADLEPEQQLYRMLGIMPPVGTESREELETACSAIIAERRAKLNNHLESLETSTDSTLSAYLDEADMVLELLRETLLADTKYGTVRLISKETEDSVEALNQEVNDISKAMSAINLDQLRERDLKRDQFVERWTR